MMTIAETLIPEETFAREILQACPRTAQRLRARREGPAYIRLGKKIFYRRAAIEDWLLAREQAQPRAKSA